MKDNYKDKKKIDQGRNIKNAREAKGLKQDTLAKLLNISQQTLSKREREELLDDNFLYKVSHVLEVSFDYLKYHEEEPTSIIFENYSNVGKTNTDNIQTDIPKDNPVRKNHSTDDVVALCKLILKEQKENFDLLLKRLEGLEKKFK